ncbi:Glycosyltransferase involved in cell wall bisynthesis [Enhydrobacter aerosaccus]|uniref:Glycosyltransferase involved in cell wall bisynthesis n=1 Tax=Enhydrobacter aerosaccus TaxID=225324 RepID=A0A1T4RY91_9HYPH|nr:glycosyltransferase [Enhydrobacter aerosaccus]SKA20816.1 Glycosyltransferase involved in cell wall bisynthesis [Enhydrobacter aerosaccus]
MHCLWITLADPEPATNGQLIYSQGLIEAARSAGASLCVLGLARVERSAPPLDRSDLTWRLLPEENRSRWKRLIDTLPEVAQRGRFRSMALALEQALAERHWDALIFDSICAGWAFDAALRHRARAGSGSKIVYIAHNHEVTVARRIADASRGLRWLLKEADYLKVMALERRMIARSDLMTSNTPDDCRRFVAEGLGTPVAFLPPGYGGPRVEARTIGAEVPRRAIVVGSFNWPPKRISLERFLASAAAPLAAAGIELQFVGEVEAAYLQSLKSRYPSVDFVGPVDDVRPYMAAARIALVPDLLGGFKLKGLDYVFNRMPILAMRVALPGMPLVDGHSIGLFDSHDELARSVLALIDDFEALNARQQAAFEACAVRFDWPRIGRHLIGHIKRADRRAGIRRTNPIALAPAIDRPAAMPRP